MRKVCAGVVSTAFAGGMLLGLAAPAQARVAHCLDYLATEHYDVWGEKHRPFKWACEAGEAKWWEECKNKLLDLHVAPWHATNACDRAKWGTGHHDHDKHDHHKHDHRFGFHH
ncbi:hypothetical protein N599_27680 [Saccharopolyspora erythraea D]|nr:hypothetical protein N599_27680 [Saccharopolyspora erythraea D]